MSFKKYYNINYYSTRFNCWKTVEEANIFYNGKWPCNRGMLLVVIICSKDGIV